MRLTKSSLFAAAAFLALPAIASADIEVPNKGFFFFSNHPDWYTDDPAGYYTGTGNSGTPRAGSSYIYPLETEGGASTHTITNISGASLIVVDKGTTMSLKNVYSTTYSGILFGEGNLIKEGTGSLQYNGGTTSDTNLETTSYLSVLGTAEPTHPNYGYFRNAMNGAGIPDIEVDPRGAHFVANETGYTTTDVAYLNLKNRLLSTTNHRTSITPGIVLPPSMIPIQNAIQDLPIPSVDGGDLTEGSVLSRISLLDDATKNVITGSFGSILGGAAAFGTAVQYGNEPLAKALASTGIYQVKYTEDPTNPDYRKNWQTYSEETDGYYTYRNDLPGYRFNWTRDEASGEYQLANGDPASSYNRNWFFPAGTIFYDGLYWEYYGAYGPSMAFGALSGTLEVHDGELDVAGFLNHWREFPTAPNGLPWSYDAEQYGANKPAMVGVGSTDMASRKVTRSPTLNSQFYYGQAELVEETWQANSTVLLNNAKLTFRNSSYNITNAPPTTPYDGVDTITHPDPHSPNTIALNFVHNLQTGALRPESEWLSYTTETVEYVILEDPSTGLPINRQGQVMDDPATLPQQSYIYLPAKKRVTTVIPRYSNDQAQSELEVGVNAPDHRLIIHQDLYVEGSVGIISGSGRVFKTGPGSLAVLNKSTLDGPLFVAGGQLILDPKAPGSGTGQELLKNVQSVNLVGIDGSRGRYMAPELRFSSIYAFSIWPYEFKMGYAPERDTGTSEETWIRTLDVFDTATGLPVQVPVIDPLTGLQVINPDTGLPATKNKQEEVRFEKIVDKFAQLVIKSNQTIHNFQALFAERSGPTDDAHTVESAVQAALRANPTEIYIAGQGIGTDVRIDTYKLTIKQDVDGVYRGNINLNWKPVNRDTEVSDVLDRGIIAHTTPTDVYAGYSYWSNTSRREVVASYQALQGAKALLAQSKLRLETYAGTDAASYYNNVLTQLNKITDATFGNQGTLLAGINLEDTLNLSVNLQSINMNLVDIQSINSLVLATSSILRLTRDDYVQYSLGVETTAVKSFYSLLWNDGGEGIYSDKIFELVTGVTLSRPVAPTAPNPGDYADPEDYAAAKAAYDVVRAQYDVYLREYQDERKALCEVQLKNVFGTDRGVVSEREAKRLLEEGMKLVEAGFEQGNSVRFGAILQAIELGNLPNAKQLFVTAGTVEKVGEGTLALLVESANIKDLSVKEGKVLANVQALGYSNVTIEDTGELRIVQTTTGTLNATLQSDHRGTLIFTTRGYVTNGSGQQILVGGDAAGTAVIRQRQDKFFGNIIIEEGVTVLLAGSTDLDGNSTANQLNDSFSNTTSFILRGGESGRETTLAINGTDQRVRNFSGDAAGRVRLGTGILVLDQEFDQVFDGKISGEGTFVKEGGGSFRLGGVSDFYGVALVREGELSLLAEDSLTRTAGLVIKAEGVVKTNALHQRVGALFGERGAVLDIGSGGLTIGITNERFAQLQQDDKIGASGLMNMNYLATYSTDLKTPGGINEVLLGLDDQSSRATKGSTVGFLLSSLVGLSNAAELAYSGEIRGSGQLIKTGRERLTINGSNPNFSGDTRIDQGILRINADSLNSSKIIINTAPDAANDFLELYVAPGNKADLNKIAVRTQEITGIGDVHKVGKGEAVLAATTYTGNTIVDEGRLVVTDINNLPKAHAQNPNGGVRINNTGTLVFAYAGASTSEYQGTVSGAGGVEKTGSGKVVLSGALSYGHSERNILDGRTLYSTGTLLPVGSYINEDGRITVRFPEGSRLNTDGTIETDITTGEIFVPRNLLNVSEPEMIPNTGLYAVQASPAGLLVQKRDADGNTILVPLDSNVFFAPAGSELRENGVVVTPDQKRLNTFGGVINAGNDWADIWLNGELVGGYAYIYEKNADGTFKLDAAGKKIPVYRYETDVNGDPVLDPGGNPVPVYVYEKDQNGDFKLDSSNNKIIARDPDGNLLKVQDYEIELNADGSPKLDANGNTIAKHWGVTLFLDPNAYLLSKTEFNGELRDWLTQSAGTLIQDSNGEIKTVTNGTTVVLGGELEIRNLPAIAGQNKPGNFEIALGATLTVNLNSGSVQNLTADIHDADTLGGGTFRKIGTDTLHVLNAQEGFTGSFAIGQGVVTLGVPDALARTRDVLMEAGTELRLNGHDQSLHYLVGEVNTTVNLGGANLTLEVARNDGEGRIHRGLLTGGGTLTKTGEGHFSLWRPASGPNNQLDNIRIERGTLQVSPTAIGNANVTVQNYFNPVTSSYEASELDFYTEAGEVQPYTGILHGDGIIGKDGAGTVYLQRTSTDPEIDRESLLNVPDGQTQFLVREGRLIVDNSRIRGEVVPGARIKTGATFQLNLVGVKYLTLGQDIVTDYAPGQHGTFALSGEKGTELTINGTPLGYTGATELVGGIKLTFNLGEAYRGKDAQLVGGLSGVAVNGDAPIVNFGGNQPRVVIAQNIAAAFAGDFTGYATGPQSLVPNASGVLNYGAGSGVVIYGGFIHDDDVLSHVALNNSAILVGQEKLIYLGSDGRGILPEGKLGELNAASDGLDLADVGGRGVGNVTIDGGKFQIGAENLHAIDVISGGTLYVANYFDQDITYKGYITNSDKSAYHLHVVTEGAGAISFDNTTFRFLERELDSLVVETGSRMALDVTGGDDLNLLFKTRNFQVQTGGIFEVNVAENLINNGSPAILGSSITGDGELVKRGDGTLTLAANQQYLGATTVNGGTLNGSFTTAGKIVVNEGGTLAPGTSIGGNSIGAITTDSNLELNGGRLNIEVESGRNDSFLVGGKVVLNGGVISVTGLTQDIARGTLFTLARSAVQGGRLAVEYVTLPTIENGSLDVPNSNENFILLGPGIGKGTPYENLANSATGADVRENLTLLVAQKQIARVPGVKIHKGLGNFLSALDTIATLQVPPLSETTAAEAYDTWYLINKGQLATLSRLPQDRAATQFAEIVKSLPGGLPTTLRPSHSDPNYKAVYDWLKASYTLGAYLNTASVENLGNLASSLSPLGFSALVAMPAAAASAGNDQLRGRMEQRRYDQGQLAEEHAWQIYFIGTSNIVRNDGGTEDAPYNFNTQGGIIGADVTVAEDTLLGAALQYTNGSATLDHGAGKHKMDAVRGTAYFSRILDRNGWFNLDAGASFGYATYDTKRNTTFGSSDGDPDGWNAGAFASLGHAFRVSDNFNILPAVGLEYTHYEISGFTENGGDAGISHLKVDDFSFDSLRVKIGSAFHAVWRNADTSWRIGLEFAYAHELLDTESKISSRFALDPFGITRSSVKSKTLSDDVIQVSPSITWGLSEQTSIFASYRWEMSFDGETQHNINVGFRYRF